ncbi:MAG: transposase zinc-binding domain-containing protein [Ideonella sp.]|nr:transposase zinc-binding domain-containing protein [Ideonella sp.]
MLECGILAHGFLRLRCGDCGHDKLVAFYCMRRGLCPSCGHAHGADRRASRRSSRTRVCRPTVDAGARLRAVLRLKRGSRLQARVRSARPCAAACACP